MDSFKVRQGSRVPLTVTQGDENSISATLRMKEQTTGEIIEVTGDFVEVDDVMVADLSLDSEDTAVAGVYDYLILENFESEDPLIYPDPSNCDGECEFPTITICESLNEEGS